VGFSHFLRPYKNIKKNWPKPIRKLSYLITMEKKQFSRSRKNMTSKQNITSLKLGKLQKLQKKTSENVLPKIVSTSSLENS
jgi:hypothetical protein